MLYKLATLIFCGCIVVCTTQVVAYDSFPLAFSIAQFRHDTTYTRVEFSYSIADTNLVFLRKGHGDSIYAIVEITIIIRTSERSDTLRVLLETAQSATRREPSTLVGQRAVILEPGQYTVIVRVRDALRERSAILERTVPLSVRKFSIGDFSASTMQLAKRIESYHISLSHQPNPALVKHGFYVIPNPSRLYEGVSAMLYAYVELYNLERCHCDSINVRYSVHDAAMNEVFDVLYRRSVLGPAQAEVVSISLEGMPTGVYYVTCAFLRPQQSEVILAREQFYLLNPELPAEQPRMLAEDELFLQSPFATMDERELDIEYRSVRFIASANELDNFIQLTTLQARRRFLFRFWLSRDRDPTTVINERYEEFVKARQYAAKFYRTARHPEGWNSDRGRVLLRYGFPTQIDRYYYNMDGAHPHEIWRYDNVQGGVIFVFVDQQGTENFVLVHSTALNEIRNENWYRQFALPNYLDPNGPIR